MQLFLNNWASRLAGPLASTAQTLLVDAADAALLAGLGAGDHYLLTLIGLDETGAEAVWEVVRATDIAGGSVTVERAQEGTAAADWPLNARIEARFTAAAAAAPAAALAAHGQAADPHGQYVQKVAGKQLSTEDYTTADKQKLAGIAADPGVVTAAGDTTLTEAHAGAYINVDAAATTRLTIAPQSSASWPDGARIDVEWAGAGEVRVSAGAGVTLRYPAAHGARVAYQHGVAHLKRIAQDLWTLYGDLGDPIPLPLLLAVISSGGVPRFYDAADWSSQPALSPAIAGGTYPSGVAFSPDGSMVAITMTYSPFIAIYETDGWTRLATPATAIGGAASCAWSPDGSRLVTVHSAAPRIEIWNTSDWSKLATPADVPAGTPYDVKFSPDGSLCVVSHATAPCITIYETTGWTKLANPATLPAGSARAATWSNDGSILAIGSDNSPYVIRYTTADWAYMGSLGVSSACYGVDFSGDDSILSVGTFGGDRLSLYETTGWTKMTAPATLPGSQVNWVSFSPDDSILALGSVNSPYLRLYNTTDWSLLSNPASAPTSQVTELAWRPAS